jgi:Flp pilus assembly protein TadG
MEFSLIILTVLSVVFWTMELSLAVYTYCVLSEAANEGVRYAITHSSDAPTATQTKATVVNWVAKTAVQPGFSASNVNATSPCGYVVCVQYPDNYSSPPARVSVTVTYPYVPMLSAIMKSPPSMHAFAEGRLMY